MEIILNINPLYKNIIYKSSRKQNDWNLPTCNVLLGPSQGNVPHIFVILQSVSQTVERHIVLCKKLDI